MVEVGLAGRGRRSSMARSRRSSIAGGLGVLGVAPEQRGLEGVDAEQFALRQRRCPGAGRPRPGRAAIRSAGSGWGAAEGCPGQPPASRAAAASPAWGGSGRRGNATGPPPSRSRAACRAGSTDDRAGSAWIPPTEAARCRAGSGSAASRSCRGGGRSRSSGPFVELAGQQPPDRRRDGVRSSRISKVHSSIGYPLAGPVRRHLWRHDQHSSRGLRQRDGIVQVPGLLSPAEVEQIRDRFHGIRSRSTTRWRSTTASPADDPLAQVPAVRPSAPPDRRRGRAAGARVDARQPDPRCGRAR